MLPWKLIAGAAFGAVIVKESHAASRFYDSVRESAMSSLRKWMPKSRRPIADHQEACADTGRGSADQGRSVSNVR